MVKCYNCGCELQRPTTYQWEDQYLGKMEIRVNTIDSVPGDYCGICPNGCLEEILSIIVLKNIEQFEQQRTEQLLLNSVGGDLAKFKENLVTKKDLVDLLGKSRQAIAWDHKINTKVFKVIEKSGNVVYWKDSVLLYKQTGDGRFDLTKYL